MVFHVVTVNVVLLKYDGFARKRGVPYIFVHVLKLTPRISGTNKQRGRQTQNLC
jgi:hypothetical protein